MGLFKAEIVHSLNPFGPQNLPRRRLHMRFTSTPGTNLIATNFFKAICKFALSNLALPYLYPLLLQEGVNIEDFAIFLISRQVRIHSFAKFKLILMLINRNFGRLAACQRILKALSKVFLDYFSVGWIITASEIRQKEKYLRFRSKILKFIWRMELLGV